jgi:GT2 family glycosyltransferase
MSTVDVIVPCYGYGHFLQKCVESVLNQSIESVRVLIIDDASPDDTPKVAANLVRNDSRVTFVRHPENKGHIATYNEGIEWASADYMLILSADDFLLSGALSRAVDLMDAHPEVGFTFGNVIELSDSGTETPVRTVETTDKSDRRILKGLEFIELSAADDLVATCTAVVRTKVQKRVGGYRKELPHAGDMEMWLRFAAHGSVGFLSAYQGVYRRHTTNMSTAYYYYTANGRFVHKARLAEIQQRKAAFDCFFETCSDALPNSERLRQKLFWSLGAMAVGRASAAFNEGQMEVSKQLAEFALGVCPQIKRSLGWIKLSCKCRMGPRVWRALQPAVARIRGEALDQR